MFPLNKLVAASLQVSWEDWMKSETSTKFYLIKCKPNDIQYWKPTRKYGRSQCKYGSMVLVSVLWWWCLVVRRVWLSCHDASVSTTPVLLAVATALLDSSPSFTNSRKGDIDPWYATATISVFIFQKQCQRHI